ncbi:uncharacterized protein LOC119591696 [Penaeus monodon]|uniref:uncharacterized protein LOC119591696 n=1 Tax=Penaeus monodon TaxID=6687 RepID=UPI0018A7BA4C|nr:uncharacterized protein LOC119591696 [Penaeus monodon]
MLDSTVYRKLSKKERTVLTRFCALHQIPVISREAVNHHMGDAPELLIRNDLGRRFASEEHELSYPASLRAFHGFLLEAKKLQALGEAQGIRRLVGICLQMPCLVIHTASQGTKRPLQEEAAQAPAGKRARLDTC